MGNGESPGTGTIVEAFVPATSAGTYLLAHRACSSQGSSSHFRDPVLVRYTSGWLVAMT
jgi:hypothetical protein